MTDPIYKRILLKMGGEALAGPDGFGIDPQRAAEVAEIVKSVYDLGVQVAIVIGGGNLWRGSVGMNQGMDRSTADHMGMIATAMNALALQDALERTGIMTRVQTAIEMRTVAEPYIRLRAIRHLDKGRVVIFGGGTGNPFFTTDTAGALRAMEINADVLIKATKVDAIYDSDPMKNPNARRYDQISYIDFLNSRLRVMDSTAVSLCMENDMPIVVLNFWQQDSVKRLILGETIGTTICNV
ncbi:MAG: UMP kinase [Chloroflexota bacterium]|nr:UMP kinase [Anaerolineales bacterium]MCA9974885.1 UMP kinase [Anaerolineales bacterium]MCB8969059.1 UMP kinase [Ardenticatenaceae bacterium]